MKNLKKTIKDNKEDFILYGGLFIIDVVINTIVFKVTNSIIKK